MLAIYSYIFLCASTTSADFPGHKMVVYICVAIWLTACIMPRGIDGQGVDLTLASGASGSDVTRAVVSKIEASEIFPTDHRLLRRIAYVESKDGEDPNTYREGYFGGIWQVDQVAFEDTQDTSSHPALINKYAAIEKDFGINWSQVAWEELQKPFFSGLAARLYLSNIPNTIPLAGDIAGQAAYWKTYYNTGEGAGTQERFIDDVSSLERNEGTVLCIGVGVGLNIPYSVRI